MNELIIRGATASGEITADLSLRTTIKSIQIDVPLDLVASGLANPTVYMSGIITGEDHKHNSTSLETVYSPHETVHIWGEGFTADTGAVIHYVQSGDPKAYIKGNNYGNQVNGIDSSGFQSWPEVIHSGSHATPTFGMP